MCVYANIKQARNGKGGLQDSDSGMHDTVLVAVKLLLEMGGVQPVPIIPRCTSACLISVICRIDDDLSKRHNTACSWDDDVAQHVWIQALLSNL